MPRKKVPRLFEVPYHVTARCINREWFRIPMPQVWDIFTDYLHFLHFSFNVRIHLFVLMSNHYHLLMTTPEANLPESMEYFNRETSRRISRQSGRINQTYGGPYHACVVDSFHYYMCAYKYAYRNPVEAGLVRFVEDYKYSTLHGLVGIAPLYIPVVEDTLLFTPTLNLENMDWLNRAPKPEHWLTVGRALKKSSFQLRMDPSTNLPHPLEKEVL